VAPRAVDALNGLGTLAVEAGRLDEAAESFRRVLQLRPDYGDAELNLAVVEASQGQADGARARLRRLLAGGPPTDLAARARRLLHDLDGAR